MEKYLRTTSSLRLLLFRTVLCTLLPLATPSMAAPANTENSPEQEEMLQQKRTWRAEKAQDFARLGDQLRSVMGALTDVLKNPQIVKDVKKRKQASEWTQSTNKSVFKTVEKLRAKQIPTTALLKESAVTLSACVDMLYEGLAKELPQSIISSSTIDKDTIAKKLEELTAQVNAQLTRTLDTQRSALSPEQQAVLPKKVESEMVDVVMLEQFVVAIAQGIEHLADAVKDYGITKVNRVARAMDKFAKKIAYNSYVPYLAVPAFFAGAGLLAWGLSKWPSAHFSSRDPITGERIDAPGGMLAEVIHGGMATALSGAGGYLMSIAWAPTKGHIAELQNRFSIWWKKFQGLPVKEKINGFEILKPEDCEGEQEPLIGLEEPFKRVMDSIESALNRIQIGEREPLKGIQRTFVFIAEAGMGKTYLMEQLKFRIAQLQQFGMPIAYENIQGEQLVFGDLMGRIKEAQQKNMGLVIWIDEMHLYKPQKDGHTPLLQQLLQTEAINKSNTPIWIFTATNEYGRFDKALIRSGRFEVINIYSPTFQDRARLFDHYLRQQGMVLPAADLKLFASQTHGASPATIRKVINSARASGKALTKELIQEKILQFVFKIVPGFELLHEKERREVAAYQSGRLLVHVLNALESSKASRKQFLTGERFALATASAVEKDMIALPGMVLDSVENNPNFAKGARRKFGKIFVYTGREDLDGTALRIQEKQLMVSELLAGTCAQELYLQDAVDDMRKDDYKLAFEYCLDSARNGIPLDMMSKQDQQECRKKALELFTAAKNRTTELLKEHIKVFKIMVNFMLQVKEFPHITAIDVIMLMEKKAPSTDPQATSDKASDQTIPESEVKKEELAREEIPSEPSVNADDKHVTLAA